MEKKLPFCLNPFITEEILKRHIKDCLKINGNQKIIMPKKGKYVKFKNCERKIKSTYTIYTYFESMLVSEQNEKQNPKESYRNKYRNIYCLQLRL